MTAGQQFVKAIKPLGCVLVLLLMVAFFVLCFTMKAPLEDYERLQTSEYYAEHLDELRAELETHMFPLMEGELSCEVKGDRLRVTIDAESFEESQRIIRHYYSKDLFIFEKTDK